MSLYPGPAPQVYTSVTGRVLGWKPEVRAIPWTLPPAAPIVPATSSLGTGGSLLAAAGGLNIGVQKPKPFSAPTFYTAYPEGGPPTPGVARGSRREPVVGILKRQVDLDGTPLVPDFMPVPSGEGPDPWEGKSARWKEIYLQELANIQKQVNAAAPEEIVYTASGATLAAAPAPITDQDAPPHGAVSVVPAPTVESKPPRTLWNLWGALNGDFENPFWDGTYGHTFPQQVKNRVRLRYKNLMNDSMFSPEEKAAAYNAIEEASDTSIGNMGALLSSNGLFGLIPERYRTLSRMLGLYKLLRPRAHAARSRRKRRKRYNPRQDYARLWRL